MVRPNEEVEALLQEYADLIAITGGEAFKARAYERAARPIGGHPADVSHLDVAGLKGVPGVGKSIAEKVIEYFRTGHVTVIEERRARIPAGVRQLITIPALGLKKATVLWEGLHISSGERAWPTPSGRGNCATWRGRPGKTTDGYEQLLLRLLTPHS
ncbi:helix-hairpin-helix protein [Streptomyces sp. SLBN-115]|nr:helix-hairpin-helix protein [Streptomyces sp. SLBN-115]